MPMPARSAVRTVTPMMGALEDAAADCLEEGCSIDTLAELIKELKVEAAANVAGDKEKEERQKQVRRSVSYDSILAHTEASLSLPRSARHRIMRMLRL